MTGATGSRVERLAGDVDPSPTRPSSRPRGREPWPAAALGEVAPGSGVDARRDVVAAGQVELAVVEEQFALAGDAAGATGRGGRRCCSAT